MIRKTALIGCPSGAWIRTHGMRELTLDAGVRPETMLKVTQRVNGDNREAVFIGPGKHALPDAEYTKVSVADGYHMDALCILLGH